MKTKLEDPEFKKIISEYNKEGFWRAIGLLAGIILVLIYSYFLNGGKF